MYRVWKMRMTEEVRMRTQRMEQGSITVEAVLADEVYRDVELGSTACDSALWVWWDIDT